MTVVTVTETIGAPIYATLGDKNSQTGVTLPFRSRWQVVQGPIDRNGLDWYCVGTNQQWVVNNRVSEGVQQAADGSGNVVSANGIVTIKRTNTADERRVHISVAGKLNGYSNPTPLEVGSQYAYNERAYDQWGGLWWNLGTAQWISENAAYEGTGDWVFPFNNVYKGYNVEGQQFGITTYDRSENQHLGWYYHNGFDFGSGLYSGSFNAIHDGTIIYTGGGYGSGLGMVILEDIGDALVIYQEFSSSPNDILVSAGTHVSAGQPIGRLTSSHMHLGISKEKDFKTALGYSYNQYSGNWYNPIATIQNKQLTF